MLKVNLPAPSLSGLPWLELNHGTVFDGYQMIVERILGLSLTRDLGACGKVNSVSVLPRCRQYYGSDLRSSFGSFASC